MIRSENAGKVGSNFILCQFSECWVHKRCSSIRGTPKEASKFKYQTCTNQLIDKAEDCPSIELNDQFLENAEKLCHLGERIGDGGGTQDQE